MEIKTMYIIKEATNAKLKITQVTVEPRKIYDTYKGGITVNAKINGFSSKFVFIAARSGDIWFTGVDCDDATINGKRTDISDGGGRTHYALRINTDVLKAAPNEKQKNFQWTGKEYSTAPIVPAFKEALQKLFQKGELTQSFLKAIGY